MTTCTWIRGKTISHLLGAVVMCTMIPMLHAQCSGNACGSIQMTFDGCYHFTNTGGQKVSIGLQPYGGISPWMSTVLGPGQKWDPAYYGDGCLTGFQGNFQANFAPNAEPGKEDEKLSSKGVRAKDTSKPPNTTTIWNARPKQQAGVGKNATTIKRNGEGLKKDDLQKMDGCAGQYTSCAATINDPANQNLMIIPAASEVQDAMRRAKECRSDVSTVTCYSSAVLACAPYILCSAP